MNDNAQCRGGRTLAAMVVSLAACGVQAQSRVEVGYAYIDGRNDAGAMAVDAGHHGDWRTVDRGSGAVLRFRHDWANFYVVADYQRLKLDSRYTSGRVDCFTSGSPIVEEPCVLFLERYHYDERYHDYGLGLGWRYQAGTSLSPWAELGVNHGRWSTSGGIREDLRDPPLPWTWRISPHSASVTAFRAAAGVDVALADNTDLSLGLSYRNKAYRSPVLDHPIPFDPRPVSSSALLEGVARLQQGFGTDWHGYIEYRPSTKRQYFQAGIGYRF